MIDGLFYEAQRIAVHILEKTASFFMKILKIDSWATLSDIHSIIKHFSLRNDEMYPMWFGEQRKNIPST